MEMLGQDPWSAEHPLHAAGYTLVCPLSRTGFVSGSSYKKVTEYVQEAAYNISNMCRVHYL